MADIDFDSARKAAKRAYKNRDYDLAANLLAPLVAGQPRTPEDGAADRTAYATTLTALSRLDEAAKYMRAAVALTPDDPRLYTKYAEILARCGHHVESAEQLKKLTTMEPDVAGNWVRLAAELNILGEEAASEAALKKALALDPNNAEAQILQLERSLTADPERDGLADEIEMEARRAGGDTTMTDWTGPPEVDRAPLRHRPWMVVVEAVALLLVGLWLQSLFL